MTAYTTREAEARFGEILRRVREGERVVLVEEGKDVAEIRPLHGEGSSQE
ncbi:MAG: type II toxin-antitoxin system Phd/YefM family antitoxin, partial [Thermoanaerobaculia bacterium]